MSAALVSAAPATTEPSAHPHNAPHRDALVAAAITLAVSALGLGVTYYFSREAQLDAVRSELAQLARVAAALVDADRHDAVARPELEGSPEHLRVLAPLVRFHQATHDVIYVYTLMLRDGKPYFGIDSAYRYKVPGDTEPHDPPMTPYPGTDPDLMRALTEGTVQVNREIVHETVRSYLSAYAPFRDTSGRLVGVVGIDMWVRDLNDRLARLRNIALTALAGLMFLSTLTGLGVFRLRTAAAVAEARDRQAVADLAAARDAAEQSSRAKSTFLAMMSHELRTPLNAIIGYGELMQEDLVARGDADMASDVGRMLTASRHLTAIIGDILDYSKLEAGRVALISTAVAPSALLVELVELMKPGATARGVALVLDAPAGIAPFAGDALRLRQVFLNLIGNAVKFTERGAVTVRLRQATRGPRRVIVAVHDTGTGIPPENLHRLFQPFSQVDSSATRAAGGTGLGLAISRRLVEMMRGTLRVKSRVGRGSSFRVSLPVQAA